jgi:aspartate/methionine/tyrosine aminotransferase
MIRVPALSARLSSIAASGIRRIADLAQLRAALGEPVYAFHLGEPGFDTPEPIKRATVRALEAGKVHYAPNAGIPELRTRISSDLSERHHLALKAESVIVTIGACEALTLALLGVLETDDEILIPTPCWPNYLQLPSIVGARAVEVATGAHAGFQIGIADLEAQITPRTRAILVTTPNNPTGAMLSRESWADIVQVARRYGLWIISDEIYRDIVYPPHTHIGVLDVVGDGDHWILLGGFSKSYAMTGWRLGFLAASPVHTKELLKLHQNLVTSATTFAQWGALEAFTLESSYYERMRAEYGGRRDLVMHSLRHSGFDFFEPRGAFYVFVRIPDAFQDSETFCEQMLRDHGLAFVPGNVFGRGFGRWFRLCFAGDLDQLKTGMDQLRRLGTVTRQG